MIFFQYACITSEIGANCLTCKKLRERKIDNIYSKHNSLWGGRGSRHNVSKVVGFFKTLTINVDCKNEIQYMYA